MIVTGVRHVGVEAIEQAARFAARCNHPLVTGFGVAGDERMGDFEDYVRAFEIAREAGLGITIHAGELMGWESVAAALDHIRPSRIGHGVRAIENADLVRRIAEEGIVLECCPGSNIALSVFPDFASHPFPALKDAGCKVTLNSDDPPYFWTSLKREYDIGREHFGMDDKALAAITKTAIEAAFIDRKTRSDLLSRLNSSTSR
jgi:adenosine deaminase